MQYIISIMETSSITKTLNVIVSLCLIIPSQVQVTLTFPTTNQPLPSPSGTMFGLQSDDLVLEGHLLLQQFVSTLKSSHSEVFNDYKESRFDNRDATCSGSFEVGGLPPHGQMAITFDYSEEDLLRTHHTFVGKYIEVMKAVIDDELLYEKPDNFVKSREEGELNFKDIKNLFERVQAILAHQIIIEGYENTGIVLFRVEESFQFLFQAETFRNIRVLCVLEDINRYLPRLQSDVTIMKNAH